MTPLILASGSASRVAMLRSAKVPFDAVAPRVDEDAIKASLLSEEASPRDIADTLAEAKARKVAQKYPGPLVLGSDQVLEVNQTLLSKPGDPADLAAQLRLLRGAKHRLHSAAVIYEDGAPVWRFVGRADLTMHPLSDAFIDDYIARNWDTVRHSVGGYHIEEEGVRLFSAITGDLFTIRGLPLLPVLSYLALRGTLPL